jgi:chromosome segregation ATPase
LNRQIREYEKDRDYIIAKISKIQSLERENNVEDLKRKRQEAESSIFEFKKTEENIISLSLQNTNIDQLINKRADLTNQKIDVQSKINSYRISIDSTLKNIERLEVSIKKVASNNDLESLMNIINSLKDSIAYTSKLLGSFISCGCTSDDVYQMITKLSSFNQISQMIHTFGKKPTDVYLKLRREDRPVDKFLRDQLKRNLSRVNDNDLKRLLSQVFQDDEIISPNCDTQFNDCAYYRFAEMINTVKDKIEEDILDDETLRYIQVISNNIDNILNELDRLSVVKIPDKMKDDLREKIILSRLDSRLPFFDVSGLQEYLSILREYELHQQNIEKLKHYEHQLSVYRKSGIDNQMSEIIQLQENISFYKNNVVTLSSTITNIATQLSNVDTHIGLVTKYADGKKYLKIIESTLEAANKILIPLESASSERIESQYKLKTLNVLIASLREDSKKIENKISEYNRLVAEEKILSRKFKDLSMILESVSTKKGIPVLYMKTYLGKIQKLANSLLKIIYGDDLQLAKFKVSQETFEIPYIKNGTKIPDVKYASQSEVPLITMALSFALAHKASSNYNILVLDEMDAGLDEGNRSAFLRMLSQQMQELKAEQVFIISHNINNIIDIPIDVIKLSDIGTNSKLQNVIYE